MCSRKYTARFVLPNSAPIPRRQAEPPRRPGFSPAPKIPRNRTSGEGPTIPVVQVVSTATVVNETNSASATEADRSRDKPRLVRRLLAGAVSIVVGAIVYAEVSPPPLIAKTDLQAIDAGSQMSHPTDPTDPTEERGEIDAAGRFEPAIKTPAAPTHTRSGAVTSVRAGRIDFHSGDDVPVNDSPVIDLVGPVPPGKRKAGK